MLGPNRQTICFLTDSEELAVWVAAPASAVPASSAPAETAPSSSERLAFSPPASEEAEVG